jgi:hypothetical protein
MSRFKKIYIDSNHRTQNSNSSSDFEIYLPESQECGNDTKLYIHEITIPNSIYPVQTGLNHTLYLRLTDFSNTTDVKVELQSSSYVGDTLATELQTMMNLATNGFMTNNDYFTVVYNFVTNKITIALNYEDFSFKIITDYEMEYNTIGWTGASYDKNNLKSINQVLGNYTPNLNYPTWASGFLTLLALRNLYLPCSELSDAKQFGSNGAYNIVKKIPINAPFGSVIYDNEIITYDYINVSNRVLRTLHFKLVNSYGNVVDLNQVNCSFSLTFVNDDDI